MTIKKLSLKNFRCFQNTSYDLCDGLNFFHGINGAGKTSILEAVYILGSGNSFRTIKTNNLIKLGSDSFKISAEISGSGHKITISKTKSKNISIKVNEKNKIKRELVSLLPINAIDSKMFFYLSSAPDYRRKSLDRSLFFVSDTYQKAWFSYYSALRQRNSSLKRNSPQEAISWNMPLSDAASVIQNERSYFLNKIKENFFNLVKDQADDGLVERLSIMNINLDKGFSNEILLDDLEASLAQDLFKKTTQCGPHKADLIFDLDSSMAKDLFSRGEEKVFSIIWGLAISMSLINHGIDNVTVLDDLSSEIDETHLETLLAIIKKAPNQFIFSNISDLFNSKIDGNFNIKKFHVEH